MLSLLFKGLFPMFDPTDRGQFLNLAGLTEGSLVAVAFGLGWWLDVGPLDTLHWNGTAVVCGIVAALPMFLVFLLGHRFPIGPLLPIKRFLIEMLGPSLAVCRWYDLILLATLAGLSEEMLFRGLFQCWFESKTGFLVGLAGASVLFGLAHLVTPAYAMLATLAGAYLGILLEVTSESNLLVPIIAHGLYDYLAFLVVIHTYRSEQEKTEAD